MNDKTSRLGRISRRWCKDERGSSMVTAALTLPFVIIIMAAVWYVYLFLSVKASLHIGVQDASRYLSEEGRYWNVDPDFTLDHEGDPHNDIDVYPQDHWNLSAKRVVANRLRTILLPKDMITESLFVTVTHPLLSYHPDLTEEPIDEGYIEMMCDPTEREEELYRHWQNIRFMVYATYKVPLWKPTIPWMGTMGVTLHDRAVGYVQCPRWYGTNMGSDVDKSRYFGKEGPHLPWRDTALTARPPSAATIDPNDTPRPTDTSTPRPTRRPSATPPTPAPPP